MARIQQMESHRSPSVDHGAANLVLPRGELSRCCRASSTQPSHLLSTIDVVSFLLPRRALRFQPCDLSNLPARSKSSGQASPPDHCCARHGSGRRHTCFGTEANHPARRAISPSPGAARLAEAMRVWLSLAL